MDNPLNFLLGPLASSEQPPVTFAWGTVMEVDPLSITLDTDLSGRPLNLVPDRLVETLEPQDRVLVMMMGRSDMRGRRVTILGKAYF